MSNDFTHIASLLQTGYYTVGVMFLEDRNPEAQRKIYTYKVPNTVKLEVNDRVIVKVVDDLKLVKVMEIHPEPQIDLNSKVPYKWIVQKVDVEGHTKLMEAEQEVQQRFFRLQQQAARDKYLEQLSLGTLANPAIEEAKARFTALLNQ